MMSIRARSRLRLLSASSACVLGAVLSLGACAEVEVGAEVAKRVSRAATIGDVQPVLQADSLAPQTNATSTPPERQSGVRLAQASGTNDGQSLPISPFLAPAPEIFEATGLAIWDGKRTLQGVWVAHPLATSARRVRIFNQGNGQAVDGALFKRDAASGGASVLISSEAAQLLGMDVGTPAELRIVAVSPIQRAPESTEPAETVAVDETAKPVQNQTLATAGTPKPDPEPAKEAPSQGVPETAPTPAAKPKQTATWTFLPREDEPTEAKEPETTARPKPAEQPEIAAATPAKPVEPAKPAKPSTLKQPYIQAGIFSVQGNATKLIRRMRSKDIPAEARPITFRGKRATKVLAGPFQTTAERSAALRTIRGPLGIRDATPVRR